MEDEKKKNVTLEIQSNPIPINAIFNRVDRDLKKGEVEKDKRS